MSGQIKKKSKTFAIAGPHFLFAFWPSGDRFCGFPCGFWIATSELYELCGLLKSSDIPGDSGSQLPYEICFLESQLCAAV